MKNEITERNIRELLKARLHYRRQEQGNVLKRFSEGLPWILWNLARNYKTKAKLWASVPVKTLETCLKQEHLSLQEIENVMNELIEYRQKSSEKMMKKIEKDLTTDKRSLLTAYLDGMKKTGRIMGYSLDGLDSTIQGIGMRYILLRAECYQMAIDDLCFVKERVEQAEAKTLD